MKSLISVLILASGLVGQREANRVKITSMIKAEKVKLQTQSALERRLMQLRIRHNLGLPASSLVYTQMTAEEKNTVRSGGESLLRDYRASIDQLTTEHRRLSELLGDRRLDAGPTLGLRKAEPISMREPEGEFGLDSVAAPGAPAGETAHIERELPVVIPVTTQIESQAATINPPGRAVRVMPSKDRSAVGRNMIRHAASLLKDATRSDASSEHVTGRRLRSRAIAVLEEARRELLKAIPEWDPTKKTLNKDSFVVPSLEDVTIQPGDTRSVRDNKNRMAKDRASALARREIVLSSLIYLGKCEEYFASVAEGAAQNVHFNAANTYYAEVIVADKMAGDKSGIWGRTATAAQSASRWEHRNGGWIVETIEKITVSNPKESVSAK